MPTSLETYFRHLNYEQFLAGLGVSNPATLAKTAEHFTVKEAKKRDEIVTSYFGRSGINRIVNTITKHLLERPELPSNAKILDVGAGTGFFTVKIAKKIQARKPGVSFYAIDLTPAMLLSLAKKNTGITPFPGIAENIEEGIAFTGERLNVPQKFDAVFSTLMLHHSLQPEKVFKSIKAVLKSNYKAIILDLCEHGFEEFRMEMGDIHLGFEPDYIYEMARKHFTKVNVKNVGHKLRMLGTSNRHLHCDHAEFLIKFD
jgi:SAM-dependent methyltransferase